MGGRAGVEEEVEENDGDSGRKKTQQQPGRLDSNYHNSAEAIRKMAFVFITLT